MYLSLGIQTSCFVWQSDIVKIIIKNYIIRDSISKLVSRLQLTILLFLLKMLGMSRTIFQVDIFLVFLTGKKYSDGIIMNMTF